MTRKTAAISGVLIAAALAYAGRGAWLKFKGPDPMTPEERAAFLARPVVRLESYSFDPSVPLAERVGPPPPFLLDWLKKYDGRDDYLGYAPTPAERKMITGWLDLLPGKMRAALEKRLIGIFLVDNFLGNGLAEMVLDPATGEKYSWVTLNAGGLRRTLSETLSEREASAFSGGGVSVECGGREPAGLFYSLLHEATHAYDYTVGITPYVEPEWFEALNGGPPRPEPAWEVWKGYSAPGPGHDFAARKRLSFYGLGGGPKLKASEASSAYESLAASPFVSLYGSQNWAEDAVELMVYAATRRLLGSSCRVKYKGPSGLTASFKPGEEASARAEALYRSLSKD
jgi:hypothetical protein